jgi:hypothetical protein
MNPNTYWPAALMLVIPILITLLILVKSLG